MATEAIPFDHSISAKPEELQSVSRLVRRLIANNRSPFTFTGTCTYIVGQGDVTVIDPGPLDGAHLDAILAATRGETIRTIMVTHPHLDHCGGCTALKDVTGATIMGCRPREAASDPRQVPMLDAALDRRYTPDLVLNEGDCVAGPGYRLEAVATPGHSADHLVFGLPEENALFSGDHVMAWSTTVVVPPDGSMRAYMQSLRKLLSREDEIYWPGHGGPVRNPKSFVNALLVHRQWREAAILRCLAAGDTTISTIVSHTYQDLAPSLRAAAAQSVLAHLIDLVGDGRVLADGPPGLQVRYALP